MPARRRHSQRNWPTGLYSSVVKGTTYYRFRDPVVGRFRGLGTDFEAARAAATTRNREIADGQAQRLTARLSGLDAPLALGTALDDFMRALRARRTGRGDDVAQVREATLADYQGYCDRFRTKVGKDTPVASITLERISDFLDGYGAKLRARKNARAVLVQVWHMLVAKGKVAQNWPSMTLTVAHAVKRMRLTTEQFDSVAAAAAVDGEAWFAAACRFALYCDQRRADVATALAADYKAGVLTFTQAKTGNVVNVTAGPKLAEAIAECLAVDSPAHTIIRKPGRKAPVSRDMLTKTFSYYRDQCIRKKHPAWRGYTLKSEGRPTWHEVRSLGAHLAKAGGLDAQALAGHSTESMAAMYQKGHAKVHEAVSL